MIGEIIHLFNTYKLYDSTQFVVLGKALGSYEDIIFQHFKGEAFLNRFSITKKRLYDHILNALDTYYAGSSLDAQLYKALNSADILYNKSLYNQCRRVLRSAEKLASKHERFAILMEISKRQKKIIENKAYSETQSVDVQQIKVNDLKILNQLESFSKLWGLKSELFIELSKKGVSRNENQKLTFDALKLELSKFTNIESTSIENKYLLNHCNSVYFFAIRNFDQCNASLISNLQLFEENELYLREHPNSYFSVLTNAIYVSEKLGDYVRATNLLQKLKSFPAKYGVDLSEDLQIKLFSSSSSIEISSYTLRGDFAAAVALIPVIENGLCLYGDKISHQRRAFLEFKFAASLVGIGNYSEALKWVNVILNDSKLDTNEDIVAFTFILDLIIHLELKHDQLLPYAIKSAERFLRSRNIMHSFEKVILRFIHRLLKTKDVFEHETVWHELHKELIDLKSDINQNVGLEYFDFEAWACSKAQRKNFQEIISLKFRQLARA